MTTDDTAAEQPTAELPPIATTPAPPMQPPAQGAPAPYNPAPAAHKAHGVEVAIALAFVGAALLFMTFVAGWTAHGVATHLHAQRFATQQSRVGDMPGDRMMRGTAPRRFDHGCSSAPGADTRRGYDDRQDYVLPEGHPDIGTQGDQGPYDPQAY